MIRNCRLWQTAVFYCKKSKSGDNNPIHGEKTVGGVIMAEKRKEPLSTPVWFSVIFWILIIGAIVFVLASIR